MLQFCCEVVTKVDWQSLLRRQRREQQAKRLDDVGIQQYYVRLHELLAKMLLCTAHGTSFKTVVTTTFANFIRVNTHTLSKDGKPTGAAHVSMVPWHIISASSHAVVTDTVLTMMRDVARKLLLADSSNQIHRGSGDGGLTTALRDFQRTNELVFELLFSASFCKFSGGSGPPAPTPLQQQQCRVHEQSPEHPQEQRRTLEHASNFVRKLQEVLQNAAGGSEQDRLHWSQVALLTPRAYVTVLEAVLREVDSMSVLLLARRVGQEAAGGPGGGEDAAVSLWRELLAFANMPRVRVQRLKSSEGVGNEYDQQPQEQQQQQQPGLLSPLNVIAWGGVRAAGLGLAAALSARTQPDTHKAEEALTTLLEQQVDTTIGLVGALVWHYLGPQPSSIVGGNRYGAGAAMAVKVPESQMLAGSGVFGVYRTDLRQRLAKREVAKDARSACSTDGSKCVIRAACRTITQLPNMVVVVERTLDGFLSQWSSSLDGTGTHDAPSVSEWRPFSVDDEAELAAEWRSLISTALLVPELAAEEFIESCVEAGAALTLFGSAWKSLGMATAGGATGTPGAQGAQGTRQDERTYEEQLQVVKVVRDLERWICFQERSGDVSSPDVEQKIVFIALQVVGLGLEIGQELQQQGGSGEGAGLALSSGSESDTVDGGGKTEGGGWWGRGRGAGAQAGGSGQPLTQADYAQQVRELLLSVAGVLERIAEERETTQPGSVHQASGLVYGLMGAIGLGSRTTRSRRFLVACRIMSLHIRCACRAMVHAATHAGDPALPFISGGGAEDETEDAEDTGAVSAGIAPLCTDEQKRLDLLPVLAVSKGYEQVADALVWGHGFIAHGYANTTTGARMGTAQLDAHRVFASALCTRLYPALPWMVCLRLF
jgi:hypothetical protein